MSHLSLGFISEQAIRRAAAKLHDGKGGIERLELQLVALYRGLFSHDYAAARKAGVVLSRNGWLGECIQFAMLAHLHAHGNTWSRVTTIRVLDDRSLREEIRDELLTPITGSDLEYVETILELRRAQKRIEQGRRYLTIQYLVHATPSGNSTIPHIEALEKYYRGLIDSGSFSVKKKYTSRPKKNTPTDNLIYSIEFSFEWEELSIDDIDSHFAKLLAVWNS